MGASTGVWSNTKMLHCLPCQWIASLSCQPYKHRHVITLNIPGAFLHAELDEDIMLLQGELAELMVKVNPKMYRPYVTPTKKGEKILYAKMKKAVYRLLCSALLFYLKLVKDLQEYGFTVNIYDPCGANKMGNVLQMTACFHVNDLKVSY